jgi:hypothetical protein
MGFSVSFLNYVRAGYNQYGDFVELVALAAPIASLVKGDGNETPPPSIDVVIIGTALLPSVDLIAFIPHRKIVLWHPHPDGSATLKVLVSNPAAANTNIILRSLGQHQHTCGVCGSIRFTVSKVS